jgi:hypothetical protein
VPRSRVAGLLRPKLLAKVTPAPAKPAPVPAPKSYALLRAVPGYYTAGDAKGRKHPVSTVRAGNYAVFNQADGMINITTQAGSPGTWINPADNHMPAAPATANTYKLNRAVRGYYSSDDAKKRQNPRVTVKAATYYIFNKAVGMINVTSKKGVPGSWINPGDNK